MDLIVTSAEQWSITRSYGLPITSTVLKLHTKFPITPALLSALESVEGMEKSEGRSQKYSRSLVRGELFPWDDLIPQLAACLNGFVAAQSSTNQTSDRS